MNGVAAAPPSRTEWICAELKGAILSGELEPGSKLVTAELSQRYQVSQTPLREAFQRLASEGLVVLSPQLGVRVAPISVQDLEELYGLRLLLEPMALEDSLRHGDAQLEADVRTAYDELRRWLESTGPEGFGSGTAVAAYERVHLTFHLTLLSRCRSTWMKRIVGTLSEHSGRYRAISWEPRGGTGAVLAEHRNLLKAVLGDDAERAVASLRRHIQVTHDVVLGELRRHPRYGDGHAEEQGAGR